MATERVGDWPRMLGDQPDEELLRIWRANDRAEWPDEAFAAIRRILEERGVEPPVQEPARRQRRR